MSGVDNAPWIWTREGRTPRGKVQTTSLGVTRDERTRAMIKQYADDRLFPVETIDVYERAYRRAGLIDGDPDEIATQLPPLSESPRIDASGQDD